MSGISTVSDLPVQSDILMDSLQVHHNVPPGELPDVRPDQYVQQEFGNYTFPFPSLAYSFGRPSSLYLEYSMGARPSSKSTTVVEPCVPHIFSDIRQNIPDADFTTGSQNYIEGQFPLRGGGLARQENARDRDSPGPHMFSDDYIFGSILKREPWPDAIASSTLSRIIIPSATTIHPTISPHPLIGQSSISGGASGVSLMPAEYQLDEMVTASLGPTLRLSSMCETPVSSEGGKVFPCAATESSTNESRTNAFPVTWSESSTSSNTPSLSTHYAKDFTKDVTCHSRKPPWEHEKMSLVQDMNTKVVQVDRTKGSDLDMAWGMPKTAYRLLSAKERKRVRNRVSARVFRVKRKQQLGDLEQKVAKCKLIAETSYSEAERLREENKNLRDRLSKLASSA